MDVIANQHAKAIQFDTLPDNGFQRLIDEIGDAITDELQFLADNQDYTKSFDWEFKSGDWAVRLHFNIEIDNQNYYEYNDMMDCTVRIDILGLTFLDVPVIGFDDYFDEDVFSYDYPKYKEQDLSYSEGRAILQGLTF